MIFEELDSKMRCIEKAQDNLIPKNCFLCARLDGRGFSRFTEDNFEKPYDFRFYRYMTETLTHLMSCGFNILIGYTQSDEISLLFHPADDTYNHKTRKLLSVLAGEASGFFSIRAGTPVSFDCRLIPLPDEQSVKDYFAWRQADSGRNSVLAHCYYKLVASGKTPQEAADYLRNLPFRDKVHLLTHFGMELKDIPKWQLYGSAVYWKETAKEGFNPATNTLQQSKRKQLVENYDLPVGEEYRKFVIKQLT